MGRLEKVKARVPYLSLSQLLQKVVSILGHELGRQLDRLHLLIGECGVVDLELVGRGWLDLFNLDLLGHLKGLDFLAKLVLKVIFLDFSLAGVLRCAHLNIKTQ